MEVVGRAAAVTGSEAQSAVGRAVAAWEAEEKAVEARAAAVLVAAKVVAVREEATAAEA